MQENQLAVLAFVSFGDWLDFLVFQSATLSCHCSFDSMVLRGTLTKRYYCSTHLRKTIY